MKGWDRNAQLQPQSNLRCIKGKKFSQIKYRMHIIHERKQVLLHFQISEYQIITIALKQYPTDNHGEVFLKYIH